MQENRIQNRVFTIPNLLSALRVALVPVFVWMYMSRKNVLATVLLIGGAGLTDMLDGLLARHMGMESRLGRILDPAADKICQAAMCLLMARRYPLMIWSLAFFAIKEAVIISLGYVYLKRTGIMNEAHWYGKAGSIVQYIVVLGLLLNPQISDFSANVMIGICIAANAVSLLFYTWFYVYGLKHPDVKPATAMRLVDWSNMVMYLLFLASVFLLMFTSGDGYLADVLPGFLFVFLRMAAIVGVTGIPAFFMGEKVKRDRLDPDAFPFAPWKWEQNGRIYEKVGIKWWKNRVPDMSKYMKRAFSKQGNLNRTPEHLHKLVLEMCSAELVHWFLFLVSPLFAILIPGWGWPIMIGYIISNIMSIIIQRYNRPRIQEIIRRIEKRNV